jgi:hypothetical protein
MSNYMNEAEIKLIKEQIKNLQSMLENENDSNRIKEINNQINGLRARLTFGANPDRGF